VNQSLLLIAGYGEIARQAILQPTIQTEELQESLAIVTRAALDAGETVKSLLTFSRSTPEGQPEHVDLGRLLHEVAQLTSPRWRDAAIADGRSIALHVAIEGDGEVTIVGWPTGLREALTHLVFNAVDALPHGGAISLAARRQGAVVQLSVTDSGVGMPPEVQAKAFEPFFSTKGEQGSGLGLAQVFGVVEHHHGEVTLKSAPGCGTTVLLSFPAAPPVVTPLSPRPPLIADAQPLRILAVDDDPAIGKMVARVLRPLRHVVTTATSGEEAVDLLAAESFDLVISDLGMGAGMTGWELAARVRERWPAVRFVLATGWGASIDPADAQARGVAAVLAKPYHPDDLQRIVTAAA
jgi:CheY-like chemotaxis protein/anti-sigma regulatory factor (Ser/Thr protein kinase)